MEILQQMEATSTLQSHIPPSPAADNPNAQSNSSSSENASNTANDSLQLDDILDFQQLDHDNVVTSESSSFVDLILGTDGNGAVLPAAMVVSSSQSVASSDVYLMNADNCTPATAHHSQVEPESTQAHHSQVEPESIQVHDSVVEHKGSQEYHSRVKHEATHVHQSHVEPDSTQWSDSIAKEEESPQIDVAINNVVCTFSTRCHLNLRHIALNGYNVELKKAQGMLNMKLRKPSATASIWSSGKITVTGASSETNCKIAARRIARKLQKCGFNVKFSSFKVVNVLGTCSLPFGILLTDFSSAHIGTVQYEPELHPGATYQIKDIRATLKIFSTGSITITAPKVDNIQLAVERVFPLVYPFKKPKRVDPKVLCYVEKEVLDYSSEAEMMSDNSDCDLEPGEIRSIASKRFITPGRGKSGPYKRPIAKVYNTINADDYGSSSDGDLGSDSNDSDE